MLSYFLHHVAGTHLGIASLAQVSKTGAVPLGATKADRCKSDLLFRCAAELHTHPHPHHTHTHIHTDTRLYTYTVSGLRACALERGQHTSTRNARSRAKTGHQDEDLRQKETASIECELTSGAIYSTAAIPLRRGSRLSDRSLPPNPELPFPCRPGRRRQAAA